MQLYVGMVEDSDSLSLADIKSKLVELSEPARKSKAIPVLLTNFGSDELAWLYSSDWTSLMLEANLRSIPNQVKGQLNLIMKLVGGIESPVMAISLEDLKVGAKKDTVQVDVKGL